MMLQAQVGHRVFVQGHQNIRDNRIVHWDKPECNNDLGLGGTTHYLALKAASEGGEIKVAPL